MATAVTTTSGPVKVKRKRMKKKKGKNYYFNQGTEDAIIRYNKSDDPHLRNKIYNDHIRAAFDKLAENIIHTFKFYYFDVSSEEVKHEVVSFLVLNIFSKVSIVFFICSFPLISLNMCRHHISLMKYVRYIAF